MAASFEVCFEWVQFNINGVVNEGVDCVKYATATNLESTRTYWPCDEVLTKVLSCCVFEDKLITPYNYLDLWRKCDEDEDEELTRNACFIDNGGLTCDSLELCGYAPLGCADDGQ